MSYRSDPFVATGLINGTRLINESIFRFHFAGQRRFYKPRIDTSMKFTEHVRWMIGAAEMVCPHLLTRDERGTLVQYCWIPGVDLEDV